MSAQGTAVVDFGTANTTASIAVTGQASFVNTMLVEAWIYPKATATNTEDDHTISKMSISVPYSKMINATGFTIDVKCLEGLAHGTFNLCWVYN